ncbi:unnamed protein product [Schistosoma margrebowiei]|uniref:Uncharacterized protein n=1 Tax=Schistosoma margrebowiei TaxID=48269 RepID=A0A183LM33_9TREM|nr:unnamed protein product [Schistosoma margrebowiei]
MTFQLCSVSNQYLSISMTSVRLRSFKLNEFYVQSDLSTVSKVNDEFIRNPTELCELLSNTHAQAFTGCDWNEYVASSLNTYALADLEFTLNIVGNSIRPLKFSFGSSCDRMLANPNKY